MGDHSWLSTFDLKDLDLGGTSAAEQLRGQFGTVANIGSGGGVRADRRNPDQGLQIGPNAWQDIVNERHGFGHGPYPREDMTDLARRVATLVDSSRPLTLRPLARGAVGEVYAIDGADAPMVVKTYHRGFERRLATEATALRLVEGLDLPLPAILAQADDLLVQRLLAGERLDETMRNHPDTRFDAVYAELAGQLRQLHTIGMDGFGKLGKIQPIDARAAYTERLELAIREWVDFGGDRATAREVEALAAENAGASWWRDCRPVLCHGDPSSGNVLVSDTGTAPDRTWRITGIVDFEAAYAGDPVGDVAWVTYHASRHQAGWVQAFVDSYGLSGSQREVLPGYELLHALELWNWFAQAGPRAELPLVAADVARLVAALTAGAERWR